MQNVLHEENERTFKCNFIAFQYDLEHYLKSGSYVVRHEYA